MAEPKGTFDLVIKVLIIGDAGVGKSCLLLRYAEDMFVPTSYSSISIDFKTRVIKVGNTRVAIQCWDTAGQERNNGTITSAYYRGANGILVVYDIASENSFNNIKSWFSKVEKSAPDDATIMLLGNKSDLASNRVVALQKGKDAAQELGVDFMEVSAKTAENVDSAFLALTKVIVEKMAPEPSGRPEPSLDLNAAPKRCHCCQQKATGID